MMQIKRVNKKLNNRDLVPILFLASVAFVVTAALVPVYLQHETAKAATLNARR